ncbi:unnamed protein product [Ceratitis capitata]|uniref:(Mediterranean fruit fly) hypothetical protein n=1 Tax=Ceratitis capitata TaxID=7213 RepID=A0A811U2N4_CERCA|nr:unnamed protein product [Ceratitis capitata]
MTNNKKSRQHQQQQQQHRRTQNSTEQKTTGSTHSPTDDTHFIAECIWLCMCIYVCLFVCECAETRSLAVLCVFVKVNQTKVTANTIDSSSSDCDDDSGRDSGSGSGPIAQHSCAWTCSGRTRTGGSAKSNATKQKSQHAKIISPQFGRFRW